MKRDWLFWINRVIGILFIVSGITYMFFGGPDGQIYPISETRAPVWLRLVSGSVLLVGGVVFMVGENDKKDEE